MKLNVFITILILFASVYSKNKIQRSESFCVTPSIDKIIDHLKKTNILESDDVEEVLCSIDRGDFLRKKTKSYFLEAIPIGYGATLSKPNVHVYAMEKALEKFPDREAELKILDIGSGSGIL